MLELKAVPKPIPQRGLEATTVATEQPRKSTEGSPGTEQGEESRSAKLLLVKGKGAPIQRRLASNPGSGLESVLGIDERTRILDTDLAPWRMICALRMRVPSGGAAIGTGWLAGPRTIITAGHCVFSQFFFGGWAEAIEISPGRNGNLFPVQTVASQRFSSVDRWVSNEDPDFDIGAIHLNDSLGDSLGWFAIGALPASELESFLVNISGYPADRGDGQEQYFHRNRILRVTERRIFYDVDTFGGQSGAPVWIHESEGAEPLAVGIHAYGVGGTPTNFAITANSAPRIIPEVFDLIRAWVDGDNQRG